MAVSAKCHARLPYGYWPWLRVTVDGEPVRPMETAGRFPNMPAIHAFGRWYTLSRIYP